MNDKKKFALTGLAGYIAPRHLKAIRDTGNDLIAALDTHDSVGIIDSYAPDARFFTEFERFDRHLEKLRRKGPEHMIDYLTICTPNFLHDAHIRLALRLHAHAICEKPLVLNPWNLDALNELEEEFGKRVYTILQLRVHPSIIDVKQKIDGSSSPSKHDVELTYITPRGRWYLQSWKGSEAKSGGLATNIGVHFFDMLTWIFGPVESLEVHVDEQLTVAGYLELERARVRWFLSIDSANLKPYCDISQGLRPYRSIKIDGSEIEFSHGFTDLHTEVYRRTLAGNGFGIEDTRQSIEIIHDIRTAQVRRDSPNVHPHLKMM